MKRIISLTLVFLMAFSLCLSATAFAASASMTVTTTVSASATAPAVSAKDSVKEAATKISKEKALEIAKSLVTDASTYDVGNISLNSNWNNGGKLWTIDMYLRTSPGGSFNVSIDADTGEINSFNIWESYNGTQNFITKMTRSEAQVKAEEYIKNQLKEDASTYELQKEDPNAYINNYSGVKQPIVYNYNYIKKINGILFPNNTISIGIDGTSGMVKNFYRGMADTKKLVFPEIKNTISAEKALENYKSNANVLLQYITNYEYKPYGAAKQMVILAYVPGSYVGMLDAVTGKVLNYDGTVLNTNTAAFKNLQEKPAMMVPGIKKLTDKKLTDAQASAIGEKFKAVIEGIYKIKFEENNNGMSNYSSSMNAVDSTWNYYWYKNKTNGSTNINLSINTLTGHVTSMGFGDYDYSSSGNSTVAVKEKYNWTKSKEKAVAMLKELLPEQYGFFVDENIVEPQLDATIKKTLKEYSFSFTRLVNGIRYRDNTISIGVDRETGVIKNFYFNWNDLDFPATDSVISRADASKKYFDQTEAKLAYFLKSSYDKNGMAVAGGTPQLIYIFSSKGASLNYGNLVMDAISGKFLDYSGNEIKPASTSDLNLDENWAKRSVELLSAQGILRKDAVEFDTGVTRFEAVKMLSLAKGMNYYEPSQVTSQSFKDVAKDNDYYMYIENAVTQKIITSTGADFKGDEKITASEFTQLLVNLLGYSDIAKHSDIFKVSDMVNVSADMAGYAAVCKAFEILPVKNTAAFDGKAELTYAMAANALYKALSYIR